MSSAWRQSPSASWTKSAAMSLSQGAHKRSGRSSMQGGFTLVELAIVLVILGVLTRSLLAPHGERLERKRYQDTVRLLQDVRHAMVGHLVTQGVLPCPLSDGAQSEGAQAPIAGGSAEPFECQNAHGRVPAATLGVMGATDTQGGLLDAWGRSLHYSVSLTSSVEAGDPDAADWLVSGEARAVGLSELDADLSLCRAAVSDTCPSRLTRADSLAFVVLSTGGDGGAAGIGRENLDDDRVFALVPPSTVPGAQFDDLLVWGSRDELAYWFLRAGWFP